MEWLETQYFGFALWRWLAAAATALVFVAASWVLRMVAYRKVGKTAWTAQSQTESVLSVLWGVLRQTTLLLALVVGTFLGSLFLGDLQGKAGTVLEKAALLALFVQLGLWGTATINLWIEHVKARRIDEDPAGVTALSVFGIAGRIGLWTILILLALSNLGVKIASLVAGLGIGGIAVALALQTVLGDLFASLSIALDKPFAVGDFIIINDMMGTVEKVGLKTTRIRSLSGELLVFSNTDLLASRIRNYKHMKERRVAFAFGVEYGTPVEKLDRIPGICREIVEAKDNRYFDRAHFKQFGSHSLDFEVVYYVRTPDYTVYMDVQQEINFELYRRLQAEGVDFAFPTQTIFVKQLPEALAGDGATRKSSLSSSPNVTDA